MKPSACLSLGGTQGLVWLAWEAWEEGGAADEGRFCAGCPWSACYILAFTLSKELAGLVKSWHLSCLQSDSQPSDEALQMCAGGRKCPKYQISRPTKIQT